MIKTFCDRCGKSSDKKMNYWIKVKAYTQTVIFFTPIGQPFANVAYHDLCDECMNEFYEWWAKREKK